MPSIPASGFDSVLDTRLFTLKGIPVTVGSLVVFGAVVLVTVVIARLLRRGAEKGLVRRHAIDVGTARMIGQLMEYLAIAVGIGIALQSIGVDVATFFAAGAFLAVAVGFAMQNIVQNFVSGIILLVERSIKPGDVLDVNGRVVRITRLGIRSTIARTRDEEDLIIPNSILAQQIVTNYTLGDSVFRLRAAVDVSYGSDMNQVMDTLRTAAGSVEGRLEKPAPRVLMTTFGGSGVNFEVSIWVQDPWDARVTLSTLNQAIWWALKKAGISIPFPQLDLHTDAAPAVPDGGPAAAPDAEPDAAPPARS